MTILGFEPEDKVEYVLVSIMLMLFMLLAVIVGYLAYRFPVVLGFSVAVFCCYKFIKGIEKIYA